MQVDKINSNLLINYAMKMLGGKCMNILILKYTNIFECKKTKNFSSI